MESLQRKPPVQAVIFDLTVEIAGLHGYDDFVIRESPGREKEFVPVSPEIATCPKCLAELFDPDDRRYRHPFINCTDCGPRFSIVCDVPYDRKFTTMKAFSMCETCQREYDDPSDRRFHAQPNACPECGPMLALLDANGKRIDTQDILSEACGFLQDGRILAIKGIGGYHLACDAANNKAVSRLRGRKHREHRPFAVMAPDVAAAKRFSFMDEEEERLLSGSVRPIVILKKRPGNVLAHEVAPGQDSFGVMLPYTPLHHLICAEFGRDLVMTSGNRSDEPVAFQDKEALARLKGIADFFLVHDREIHIRTDDSVVRVFDGKERQIRRSRGYAPFPLLLPFSTSGPVLACGAALKNTFCLARERYAFLSHHIGDLENLETLASFEQGIEHFKRIFHIEPTCAAHDLHPDYLSTRYAKGLSGVKTIGVQHHHAHIASCMADNRLQGEVIGVAFDGAGLGTDGNIWGGEFLLCDYAGFTRMAHLENTALPGGDRAVLEPWRLAASLLYRSFGEKMLDCGIGFIDSLDMDAWTTVRSMIDSNVNCPLTSSAGRLFDAVSALLGIRQEVYYEGQAAIELEMACGNDTDGFYPVELREHGNTFEVLLEPLVRGIVEDLVKRTATDVAAARFHNTLTEIICAVCLKIRALSRQRRVVLSGGVFQNRRLLEAVYTRLGAEGFDVFMHQAIPTNDGGISLGQIAVAAAIRTS